MASSYGKCNGDIHESSWKVRPWNNDLTNGRAFRLEPATFGKVEISHWFGSIFCYFFPFWNDETFLNLSYIYLYYLHDLQDKISFEGLRLATELPESELRRTLFSLASFPKLRKQLLCCDLPELKTPKDFFDSTNFWVNQEFCLM